MKGADRAKMKTIPLKFSPFLLYAALTLILNEYSEG